MLDTKYSV